MFYRTPPIVMVYERDFMKSLSWENQADIIEAFNSISRYLQDDLLNIGNIYFDQMVDRIYPTELQLNRANSSDTEAPFFDLYVYLMVQFPPKVTINGTILILIYSISHFWVAMSPGVPHMEYTYLQSFFKS